ncbi:MULTISPECIES: entericidin A/B family lipoprotein [Lysobacter]|jgi:entericidin A|uniref:Entericidin, EcnA/B family n=1 Tax=Lysobacter soli TaxID=453783 RepID=A0A3D8VH76_9GAMM|nr:entericidin A/B family lipoprotein [Lysobacter soli]MDG2517040.1 entericidin A/B family lipoprotein [Lysobacter soli]QGW63995.1 entericidin A/B family lipoprotein [Lysobacter soli]RDY68762.1 entericidin, EcnA/B family [Lysobacter soli]UTA54254.1 entericidin A/B family lipoprotein [Lysobacter soli]
MKRSIATLLLVALSLVLLNGCNTMEGLGKDVEKLGQKIDQKASN